ncbi:MAG: 6-pyruvoyl-tetrahydropterin synthase-related protein [Candidatus Korobacteraceae bacterium]
MTSLASRGELPDVNIEPMPQSVSSVRRATVVVLAFAALAVVAPFSVRGVACGHDLTFHMNSWMEVAQQWRQGVIYPRWAGYANYGSGEPRFLFYPPLSWILGGALGIFIPWLFVPVAFDGCAVFLSGLAMHKMARQWFDEPDATLIAVAYAVSPYMLLTIYVRSAFAELLAASLLPLLVLWIVRDRPPRAMFIPLALTIAAVWLTNVPAAIIMTYVAVLLLAVVTIFRRNSRVFLYGVAAVAMGLLLASFYIVPVLYERNWITLGQALSAGVRPAENFLFARTGEPEHDAFLRTLSWLAVGELAITAVAMFVARKWRARNPRLWWSLVILAGVSLALMLPVTSLAYRLMPDLRFLQFPWRWLLVTGIAYAVFVVTAAPRFRGKALLYAVLFLALIAACNMALQPQCDPEDTPYMIANLFHTGYGYMGTDEYVPAGGDNYEIKPDFPEYRFRYENGGAAPNGARVTHLHTNAYRKQLTIESPQPVELVLRLMNYPAWRVNVNGAAVTSQSDDPTGRMVIAVPAGHSDIDVRFIRTPDRWLGDGLSLAALILLCGFWYVERKTGFLPQRHRDTE